MLDVILFVAGALCVSIGLYGCRSRSYDRNSVITVFAGLTVIACSAHHRTKTLREINDVSVRLRNRVREFRCGE